MRVGYLIFDAIEQRKHFFGQNTLRVSLISYFSIIAFFFKKTRFDLYLRIGSLYLNLKKMKKSEYYYGLANDLVRNNDMLARVFMCLGNLSLAVGRYGEAISYYEQVLEISRYKTTILSNLAFAYEAINEYEKALKYARDSIEVSRREPDLGHTILPEDNVRELIDRLKEKLSSCPR